MVALTTSFENADACTGGDFFECKVASSSAALLAAGSASCVLGVVEVNDFLHQRDFFRVFLIVLPRVSAYFRCRAVR